MDELELVYKHIDENCDKYVADLRKFLRQPSISAQNNGVRECAEMLSAFLKDLGAETTLVPLAGGKGFPVVYAEVGSKEGGAPKRTILVYCLYDVQPVDQDRWSSDPFGAEWQRQHKCGDPDRDGPPVRCRSDWTQ